MNHSEIASFIWGVADLIRDTFKRGKYQDVILPLTVLRRLDSVLAPTKRKVLAVQAKYRGRIENLDPQLSTPAENCTFMAGENCTPDDWVTNPKTPAPPGISCER